jgi:murein biosynthesis integral membrane protein MurJ
MSSSNLTAPAPPSTTVRAVPVNRPARAVGRGASAVLDLALSPLTAALTCLRVLLHRPAILVAASILLVCVPSNNTDVSASVHVTAVDVGTLGLVGLVALRYLSGERALPHSARIAFTGMLVALGVATIASQDVASSLSGFVRYAQLFVVIPVAVMVALRDRRDLMLVGGAVLAVALLEGAVGVWQYATHTGASYGGASAASNIRAVGTFGALDIMGMATVVSYGLLAALGLGFGLRGKTRAAMLCVAAALGLPLVFSLSRGSWIATACGAALVLLLAGWRTALRTVVLLVAAGIVLFGTVGAGSQTIGDRVGSIFSSTSAPDQSVNDRYDLWHTAFSIWTDHPLTGVGPKQFQNFRDSHAPLNLSSYSDAADPKLGYQREPLLSPHNMYLLVLSEQGFIGLLGFGGLWLAVLGHAVRRTLRTRTPERVVGLAVCGFLVCQMVDFLYADIGGASTVLMAVLFGVAAWWAFGDLRGPAPRRAAWPWSRRGVGWPRAWTRGWFAMTPRAMTPRAMTARPATVAAALGPVPSPTVVAPTVVAPGMATGTTARVATGRPEVQPPSPPRPAAPSPPPAGHGRGLRRTVLRAAALTAMLSALGSVFGLVRDQLLASFFGASGGSDAFLVAWTVPETVAPLLIEDAMSFLMVPAFSRALARERDLRLAGRASAENPVRELVSATLPGLSLALAGLALITGALAPVIVHLLGPGLEDPGLAITCMRLTSVTVLTFGVCGYLSAALRSHQVFGSPAAIYTAYNIGILAMMLTLHGRIGVVSAAIGVAIGSLLMVAIQAPDFIRRVGLPRLSAAKTTMIGLAAFLPIGTFTLTRQAQVLIERYLSSSLAPGTISHLNYAQKVAQVPMSLSVMLCTVTFPALALSMNAGETEAVRRQLQRDLGIVSAMILLATSFVVAFAPDIVGVLFQHGEFTVADTDATAAVMRVYALGLLGQTLVAALCRPFFSQREPTWFPALAMGIGLVATAVFAVATIPLWGARAIAGANAVGISLTAVLLLFQLRRQVVPVSPLALGVTVGRLVVAAIGATSAGVIVDRAMPATEPLIGALVGGVAVTVTFVLIALVMGSQEIGAMAAPIRRRLFGAS